MTPQRDRPMPQGVPDVGSRNIRGVEPFVPVPDHAEHATWTCTRCSNEFQVQDSHLVKFRSGDREFGFVVCPDCAARYRTPWPVVIDLTKIPPPLEHEHPGMRRIAEHVEYVRHARSEPPEGWLQLRDADLRVLALVLDVTPDELAEMMRRRDVLI